MRIAKASFITMALSAVTGGWSSALRRFTLEARSPGRCGAFTDVSIGKAQAGSFSLGRRRQADEVAFAMQEYALTSCKT